jgi:transposase
VINTALHIIKPIGLSNIESILSNLKLNSILLSKNIRAKAARELIPKFTDFIDQFANSPVKALAQTLKSWLEPIARMWSFSKSNGIT